MIYRRKDGSWILVDYKTNRLTPEREKDFLRHYGRQMELYAMALAKLFDIKVSPKRLFIWLRSIVFTLLSHFFSHRLI